MNLPRTPFMALCLVTALVVLPFGRTMEIPMALLAIAGVIALVRGPDLRSGAVWLPLAVLFAAFALPMLLALPDAVKQEKALLSTVGSLRYGLSCAALLGWYQGRVSMVDEREVLLDRMGLVVAVLLALWCLDALLQFFTGQNILGYGVGEGYINGVFGDEDNIKFGITVALLLPVGLVYGLRQWPAAAVWVFLLFVLTLIVLSGKRSAWISATVELAVLGMYYFNRGRLSLHRVGSLLGGVTLALVFAYNSSDWVRDRSVVIVQAFEQRDYATVNRATGLRLPIWSTAVKMGEAHWINGVGPRGFRYAYPEFAAAGDTWADPSGYRGGSRASHAHQLLLELWTETGVIGLAGYLVFIGVLWRLWRGASAAARSRALPYAATLAGVLFPINTHLAWYSSWHALLLWLMVGLYLLAISEDASGAVSKTVAKDAPL